MANDNEKLTITLTGKAPVKITKADWPGIASARDSDNQYESQATRTWTLRVRQHQDGRAIVYGIYTTQWAKEKDRRGGQMVAPGGDIPLAIQAVAATLKFDDELADRCIADLPAVEI